MSVKTFKLALSRSLFVHDLYNFFFPQSFSPNVSSVDLRSRLPDLSVPQDSVPWPVPSVIMWHTAWPCSNPGASQDDHVSYISLYHCMCQAVQSGMTMFKPRGKKGLQCCLLVSFKSFYAPGSNGAYCFVLSVCLLSTLTYPITFEAQEIET